MTAEEGPTVEAVVETELLTGSTAGKTGEAILKAEESQAIFKAEESQAIFKAEESQAPSTVKPEAESETESPTPLVVKYEAESGVESAAPAEVKSESISVEEPVIAVEANNSSENVDFVEAKVGVLKDIKEERNGTQAKVVANGISGLNPKREDNGEDAESNLEGDAVTILPHWYAKPCVQITGLAGVVTEEDLMSSLSQAGPIANIVFENDRRDTAIIRYDASGTETDDLVAKVREIINNNQIKDRTLVVEPFRSDSLLFIGNLTPEIDDTLLKQMFEPHGTVERAFVLRNSDGRSKGYGFVEYRLKSQASLAKVAMGNINMDGRVLRVEWSDCRKISDMFSTVLFVDRIAKDASQIEQTLRTIFGKFGRVRDCHLAIGINQQLRGFGFIDFYESTCADKAHESLDGKEVEGSHIRVSFANPSKSAQSYKSRFGTQATVQPAVNQVRGAFPDHVIRPVVPVVGVMRGPMGLPIVGNRYLAHGRNNMLGMSIGLQFGRGAPVGPGMIGRNLVSPLIGSAAGMLGPGSVAAGVMGRGQGLILGHTGQRALVGAYGQQGLRVSSGRGPIPISSVAIAQVATAQAKAREEEAKARAVAQAKQLQADAKQNVADQERLEQFRKMAAQQAQLTSHQNYYQQQSQSSGLDQHYKQGSSQYSYQQPYQQTAQLQSASNTQYQHPPASQQTQQSYSSQYYSVPTQQYTQQAQPQQQQHQAQPQSPPEAPQQPQQATEQNTVPDYGQYSQQQAYYQQPAQPSQAGASTQPQYAQYAQQYGQQYAQQYQQQQQQQQQQVTQQQQVQQYGQQPITQQYVDTTQQQAPAEYTQQDYANYYAQQQQPQVQQAQTPVAVAAATTIATPTQTGEVSQQQQAYASYYQQRAQEAVAQAGTAASHTGTTSTVGSSSSLEAQWAAYYAAQAAAQQQAAGTTTAYDQQQTSYAQQTPLTGTAAYYQQPASVDVGQKRAADQIDYATQAQASYNYQPQPVTASVGYTQQQTFNNAVAYHQQAGTTTGVQQPAVAVANYQQSAIGYAQQPATPLSTYPQPTSGNTGYTPAVAGGYQPVATPSPSGYQQSASLVGGYQQPSAGPVSTYSQPNQAAAQAAVYDYSKRPRY